MRQMMRGLSQLVRDVGYGIHAGNAIGTDCRRPRVPDDGRTSRLESPA